MHGEASALFVILEDIAAEASRWWLKRVINFLLYIVNDQNCVSVVSEAEHSRYEPNVVPPSQPAAREAKEGLS